MQCCFEITRSNLVFKISLTDFIKKQNESFQIQIRFYLKNIRNVNRKTVK